MKHNDNSVNVTIFFVIIIIAHTSYIYYFPVFGNVLLISFTIIIIIIIIIILARQYTLIRLLMDFTETNAPAVTLIFTASLTSLPQQANVTPIYKIEEIVEKSTNRNTTRQLR